MGYIDYSREPNSDIAFVDMKSFYASVECVKRNLHPLKTSLCVMSRADNANGLILASSPVFKQVFGKDNVGRARDLPFDVKTRRFNYANAAKLGVRVTREYVRFIESWAQRTLIVPPRMALYIEENLKIQQIFRRYAPENRVCPYSIDEGFVDLSSSLDYFVSDKSMSRADKLNLVSGRIQAEIRNETGIFSTIGMSNSNPLLAKLALDNEAKKTPTMKINWSYQDVETKVWGIKNLTDFWGIGNRTAKRLNRLGIFSVRELANSNPNRLKKEFGVIGVQLWFHANGVDESKLSRPYQPKSKGLGNSQVLPRDYHAKSEIELVLREMAEQVAVRLRRAHKKTTVVGIHIGFSHREELPSINARMTVSASQSTQMLAKHILELFRSKYVYGSVRRIGVNYEGLVDEACGVYTLFDDVERLDKEEQLDRTIDKIRDKFSYISVQNASSLLEGSRVKERSTLIGGHCGGLDGIV